MRKMFMILLIIAVLCSCTVQQPPQETGVSQTETNATTVTEAVSENIFITSPTTSAYESKTTTMEEKTHYINNFIDSQIDLLNNESVTFYDIDDDGVSELFVSSYAWQKKVYNIYEISEDEITELYTLAYIDESSEYLSNSSLGGMVKKYHDKKNNEDFYIYDDIDILENIDFADGHINIVYGINKLAFRENILVLDNIAFADAGTCMSAIEPNLIPDPTWQYPWIYVYIENNVFTGHESEPLGYFNLGTDGKFNKEFDEYISQYELIETIDFDSLEHITNKADIYKKISAIDTTKNIVADDLVFNSNEYQPFVPTISEIPVSNYEDYIKIKDTPHRFVIITPENSNSDYFEFLYDDREIECIKFVDCTQEQINDVLSNMPSLKCYFYGYLDV
jgi:hypothetical protein